MSLLVFFFFFTLSSFLHYIFLHCIFIIVFAYLSLQFVKFANINEDTPSYHRRYDFFISKFSSMCHGNNDNIELRDSIRLAGIKGLQGVIRKTVSDDLVENIWEKQHMEKIVPSLLFNMQVRIALKVIEREMTGIQLSCCIVCHILKKKSTQTKLNIYCILFMYFSYFLYTFFCNFIYCAYTLYTLNKTQILFYKITLTIV